VTDGDILASPFSEGRAFAYGLRNKPAPLSGDVLNRGLMWERV